MSFNNSPSYLTTTTEKDDATVHLLHAVGGPTTTSSASLYETFPSSYVDASDAAVPTEYASMLLALDDIPSYCNLLAAFFNVTWILLAGFVLYPVTSVPLYGIAWVCSTIGGAGLLGLWWTWRDNYVWTVNHIFIPGLLNSLAAMLSTLASVYGAQRGAFSDTSRLALSVNAAVALVCAVLFAVYDRVLLARLKKQHDKVAGGQRAFRKSGLV
ncbi:hypothetical protein BU15DRAFT_64855 [Melanogaster broomeanus]|nr:hypothetical protein BU15DRAFT_64855 [Melanogaster broomeanus]